MTVFLVGVAALVGGMQGKGNPFFGSRSSKSVALKTPRHDMVFGLIAIGAVVFLVYRVPTSVGILRCILPVRSM